MNGKHFLALLIIVEICWLALLTCGAVSVYQYVTR